MNNYLFSIDGQTLNSFLDPTGQLLKLIIPWIPSCLAERESERE